MQLKEQFIFRLVELMFQKQQTFLLLDELYEDQIVGSSIRNIQIDSPFQQLLFEGVLSQHIIDDSVSISFTVEAYFQHLLAKFLEKSSQYVTPDILLQLLKQNKLKGLPEAVSNLLCFDIEKGNFNRLADFIDLNEEGNKTLDLCVMPLIYSLKSNRVEKIMENILENHTEADWLMINLAITKMELLQLFEEIKQFLKAISTINPLKTNTQIEIGIKDLVFSNEIPTKEGIAIFEESPKFEIILNDWNLINLLGDCFTKANLFEGALFYYNKSFKIELKKSGYYHSNIAILLNRLGKTEESLGNLSNARNYYLRSLELKDYVINFADLANLLDDLGRIEKKLENWEESFSYFKKALLIREKENGLFNIETAKSFFNIGSIHDFRNNFNDIIFLEKALKIRIKLLGINNLLVAEVYERIGVEYYGHAISHAVIYNKESRLNNIRLALNNLQKSFQIKIHLGLITSLKSCFFWFYEIQNDFKSDFDYFLNSLNENDHKLFSLNYSNYVNEQFDPNHKSKDDSFGKVKDDQKNLNNDTFNLPDEDDLPF